MEIKEELENLWANRGCLPETDRKMTEEKFSLLADPGLDGSDAIGVIAELLHISGEHQSLLVPAN